MEERKKVDISKLRELDEKATHIRDELKYLLNYYKLERREFVSDTFQAAHMVSSRIRNIIHIEEHAARTAKLTVHHPKIFSY